MIENFARYRYKDTITMSQKARRALWLLVWILLFRPSVRGLMNDWRLFLLRCFGAKIGAGSRISPSCFVWAPWNLEMGKFSTLGDDVDCYSMDKIQIGSKATISQRTFLCTGSHDARSLLRPLVTRPIFIGDHCWIAAESMVMPGVTIGTGTIVGARSLVTRNLPEWSVCLGSPCKVKRRRELIELSEALK